MTTIKALNKVIRDGFKHANDVIERELTIRMGQLGYALIQHASQVKDYSNLTGNTITSLAFGLYRDGKLTSMSFLHGQKPPIDFKLKEGEPYVGTSYDGNFRVFLADIDTDGRYGWQTSMDFLRAYTPDTKKGWAIAVCTGTEYSEFLENVYKLHVLNTTYGQVASIARVYFVPIPDSKF